MTRDCPLCDGSCEGADLTQLLMSELDWLWRAIADAAERRGDPVMTGGPRIMVTAPTEPSERAAAAGLFHGRTLQAGQRRRLDLAAVHRMVQNRGERLTPGAVAAHAVGRPLAIKALERAARTRRHATLQAALTDAATHTAALGEVEPDRVFGHLRRTGWISKLDSHTDAHDLLASACEIAARVLSIPTGRRLDRRLVVSGHPHALDEGTVLGGLVLAILAGAGHITPGRGAREAWAQVGVNCDEIMGGVAALGIHPDGWGLPPMSVATIPPRELLRCTWPAPAESGTWVFITENPSVFTAAADQAYASDRGIRLLCTLGTPGADEIASLAQLSTVGWNMAVRADFDAAGVNHVGALLNGIPGAVTWRMGTADYRTAIERRDYDIAFEKWDIAAVTWEDDLANAIAVGGPAYEEALMTELLADLSAGRPCASTDV